MKKFISESSSKVKELEHEVKQLRNAVEELKVLNEIAVSAGMATDVDQMLNIIVKKSIRAIDAEQSLILLVTKNQDDPFKTIKRQDDTSKLQHNYRVGRHITGWVLLNKESLIIEDLSKDERFHATEEEKKDIHSVLCVPIWFEGDIIGIMMAINKKNEKKFSQSDLTLFSIISVQAGQLIKNLQLQQETFQKRKEAEKFQELDRIKTNFFTNISHEFRTPLTLILGPLEKLMNEEQNPGNVQAQYQLIHNNADKLLSLINQILDLSSIDAGKMNLEVERNDLLIFIKGIAASFQILIENKNIDFKLISDLEKLEVYFDKDKIEKIISNLLSNAIKFTNSKGKITVSILRQDEENITIIVEDNGIGIAEDEVKNIFNRFYKAGTSSIYEGTGIGLALVKELVELHFGTISVQSKLQKGTKFIIALPLTESLYENFIVRKGQHEKSPPPIIIKKKEELIDDEAENESSSKPSVLIVEDNDDLRKFIKDNVGSQYSVLEAENGKTGLDKALELIPDLIISDVKMPEMDGIELCKKIKTDEKTSHIPFILLTARSTLGNKLEGLETGADDYITKPFQISELQVRVNNLIEQREKLRKRFRKEIVLEPKDIAISSTDEKFLVRIMELLEKNVSNEDFTVDEFAKQIGISRMQLHRKLHALTDQSASEFIRNFRLKRGMKLLSAKKGNISEIAYEVGFSNPSYFAECFKNLFGFSPSDYLANSNKL
jgi:signal transduction histidine kinase/DNA-binding response OmpR family regulator